jgi:hypothetical protein
MADNAQKTPFGVSMNRFATEKTKKAIQVLGKSLPATVVAVRGAIVQVQFEVQSSFTLNNVTIPLIGCEYARPPIQKGCKGFVIAADAYIGGMSGIGGGTADLTPQFNLTALVFAPIGNTGWTVVDPNAYVIYGPNGVVIRTQDSTISLTLTPSGIAIIGNVTIQGSLTATGDITAGQGTGDQVDMQNHTHDVVNVSGGTATIITSKPIVGS